MAVETTTITDSLTAPDGTPLTMGFVRIQLSEPGKTDDGATEVWVAGVQQALIKSDGTLVEDDGSTPLALIPNDAITPSGTYYKVWFDVRTPYRLRWSEKWNVETVPDPVDIGAIERV